MFLELALLSAATVQPANIGVSPTPSTLVAKARPVRRRRPVTRYNNPPAPRGYSCYNDFGRRRNCTNEWRKRPGVRYDRRVPRLSSTFSEQLFAGDTTPPLPPSRIGCGTNPFCATIKPIPTTLLG